MSMMGRLIYSKDHYADQSGWFKVTEDSGYHVRGQRIMRPDGTVVKNSKLRIKFKLSEVEVVTPAKLEEQRDAAYKAADAQYQHLMDAFHK